MRNRLTLISVLVLCSWTAAVSSQDPSPAALTEPAVEENEAWPREFVGEKGGRALIYQPQIVAWDDFSALHARVAVAVTLPGEDEPNLGAVEIVGRTDTDLEARVVGVSDLRIESSSFPTLDPESSNRLTEALDPNFDNARSHLKPKKLAPSQVPRVYVAEKPAELIVIYGETALERIDGTDLLWVTNSESDLFLAMLPSLWAERDHLAPL